MRRIPSTLRASIAAYLPATDTEKVPPGWHTSKAIEKLTGYSQRGTNLILRKMLSIGDAEVRKFKILTGQVIRPVPHYRFNQRAAKALGLDKRPKT